MDFSNYRLNFPKHATAFVGFEGLPPWERRRPRRRFFFSHDFTRIKPTQENRQTDWLTVAGCPMSHRAILNTHRLPTFSNHGKSGVITPFPPCRSWGQNERRARVLPGNLCCSG
jgi:hypothetical protein